MSVSRRLLFAALALAAVGLFVLLVASRSPRLFPGARAPEFRLAGLDGRPASLSDYRGRAVLVDFWATWCDTCQEELPVLIKLYQKYRGERFELLAVSVDEGGSALVSRFARAVGLPYPVLLADYSTVQSYEISPIPVKFLIDQNGIIYRKYLGPVDPAELGADIETLLKSGGKP